MIARQKVLRLIKGSRQIVINVTTLDSIWFSLTFRVHEYFFLL
jgi:hypothetical protein